MMTLFQADTRAYGRAQQQENKPYEECVTFPERQVCSFTAKIIYITCSKPY